MAFDKERLNNIAGSMGQSNIWIYTPIFSVEFDLLAEVTADGYFNAAKEQGLKHHDTIITVCSNGTGIFRVIWQQTQNYFYVLDIKSKP